MEIEYPGDPTAPGRLVYNCRCTLIADIEGVDGPVKKRHNRLNGKSYEQWKYELGNNNSGTKTLQNGGKNGIIKKKNSELKNGLPIKGEPNSIVDKVDDSGKTLQRVYYGENGLATVQYDTTNHNRPDIHPTNAHKHIFDYSKKKPRSSWKAISDDELEQNSDIIQKGVNYFDPE